MSNMLEQAIIDAAALREAALKNAEQNLIEKFAPQIKEAVEAMLETDELSEGHCVKGETKMHKGKVVEVVYEADDDGKVTVKAEGEKSYMVPESELKDVDEGMLQEQEEGGMETATPAADSAIEAPFAGNPTMSAEQSVEFSLDIEDLGDDIVSIDLDALEAAMSAQDDAPVKADDLVSRDETADEVDAESELDKFDDLLSSIGNEDDEEEDKQLQELLDLLSDEVLEEEFTVDMGARKTGTFETNQGELQYQADMETARRVAEEEKEELDEDEEEETTGVVNELHETISALDSQNEKLESVIYQLSNKLEETLLSNAKLIYQNRTLSDASLNERQKSKIVEAIASAESPKEAKQLHETLKATVGSNSKKHGPQSLSESVNRKSNLSAMLNTRQNLRENKSSDPFMEKMQKLAGIK